MIALDTLPPARPWAPAIVIGFVLALAFMAALALAGPLGFLLPLALLAVAIGGLVVIAAMRGKHWALAGMLGFALVVPNISFVEHELHDTTSMNPQNLLKVAVWAAMAAIGAARWRACAPLMRDGVLASLLAFSLIALVSTTWSPVPAYTAVGAAGFLASLVFCCVVAVEVPGAMLLRYVVIAMVGYLAINTIAMVALPNSAWAEDAAGSRFQGVSTHANILAKELAALICLVTPLALSLGRRRLALGLIVVTIGLMLPTGSRTALAGILLAFILPLALDRRARAPIAIAIAILGMAILALALGWHPDTQALTGGVSRDDDGGDVMTLTGRTELWAFVWDKIQQAPLIGHGFISADNVLSADWWGPPDASVGAHNAWLQCLLMLGLVGTVPFATMHIAMWRQWLRGAPYLRLIVPFLTVLGFTEVEIAAQPVEITLVFFLLAALNAQAAAALKKKGALAG